MTIKFLLSTILAFVIAGPAYAGDHEKHGNGREHRTSEERQSEHQDNRSGVAEVIAGVVDALIDDEDRATIGRYVVHEHSRHCPPGLAKKHNGCMPPGLAKKYTVGREISENVEIFPISDDLLGLLKPHKGYYYGEVDGDILLISEATKKVVDAVTLLSAVGN